MSYIKEWWIGHNFHFCSLSFSFQPYNIWRWYIISCHVLTGRELFSYGKFWNRQMNLSKPYERSHPKKYDALTEKREKYILLNVKKINRIIRLLQNRFDCTPFLFSFICKFCYYNIPWTFSSNLYLRVAIIQYTYI